jgi:hypothetical protein
MTRISLQPRQNGAGNTVPVVPVALPRIPWYDSAFRRFRLAMPPHAVPAVRTPFTELEILAALEAAWKPELGGDPPHEALAVLAAQIALETGNGAQCWNHNPGNYKQVPDRDWMPLHTTERVPVTQPDGSTALVTRPMVCLFASYDSLADGVQAFVHAQWSRWTVAWNVGVSQGNPEAYAHALYNQKPPYFTADPDLYAKGCRHYFDQYLALLGPNPPPVVAIAPIVRYVGDPADLAVS